MIISWLIELYLNQLGEMKDQGAKAKSDLDRAQEDFRKLLAQSRVKVCTNLEFEVFNVMRWCLVMPKLSLVNVGYRFLKMAQILFHCHPYTKASVV